MKRRFIVTTLTYALRCYDRKRLIYELRFDFRKAPHPEAFLSQLPAVVEFVRERGDKLEESLPACFALLDLLSTWSADPRYVEYRKALDDWLTEHPDVQLPPMRRLMPLSR